MPDVTALLEAARNAAPDERSGASGPVVTSAATTAERDQAAEIFDATGLLVTPGLVDTHVHVYDSLVPLGIDADRHCLGRGSTTVVDAGSAGCNTLAGLKRFAVASQKTRILALLHVASHGLASARTTPPQLP